MTLDKEKTPDPSKPIKAVDAERIFQAIQDLSARVATVQFQVITMTDNVKAVSRDFADTRVQRLQQEILDNEKERQILEERIKIVDTKLEEKKMATVGAINTTDRFKQVADLTYEERERIEKEARAAAWARRKETITTAVLVSLSVGFVGSLVAAIWWFVMFYMQNR